MSPKSRDMLPLVTDSFFVNRTETSKSPLTCCSTFTLTLFQTFQRFRQSGSWAWCERGVVDQRLRLLIRGSAQGISLGTDHIEGEVEDQEDEVEDERDCQECKVESRREVRHTSA